MQTRFCRYLARLRGKIEQRFGGHSKAIGKKNTHTQFWEIGLKFADAVQTVFANLT